MARYLGNEKDYYCCSCETYFSKHENKGRWENHHVICPCCKEQWWERDVVVKVMRPKVVKPFIVWT